MIPRCIRWREAEPEVRVREFDQLARQSHWADSTAFIRNANAGQKVYITRHAEQAIAAHLESEDAELGGLLLGRVYETRFATATNYPWITVVEQAVASTEYCNSSVSLRMGTEVWSRAGERLQNGLMVVGWYHSHPNLGVFFSGTDRATQSAFFNHPYALGLVVDPIRKERKCFFGGTSEELPDEAMLVM